MRETLNKATQGKRSEVPPPTHLEERGPANDGSSLLICRHVVCGDSHDFFMTWIPLDKHWQLNAPLPPVSPNQKCLPRTMLQEVTRRPSPFLPGTLPCPPIAWVLFVSHMSERNERAPLEVQEAEGYRFGAPVQRAVRGALRPRKPREWRCAWFMRRVGGQPPQTEPKPAIQTVK